MDKKLFIETLGCQMNSRDTEHIIAELSKDNQYTTTQILEEADLIIINTCSVRERPVAKLFSELGQFNKQKKNGAKIGVCGCTASHLGGDIIKRAPYVDFVVGARNVSKISQAVKTKGTIEIDINHDETTYEFAEFRNSLYKVSVNISLGCDKSCTYCIVPATRGEEISIPSELIISELEKAVLTGACEVNLLGQNVNNYGKYFKDSHQKYNFTSLLKDISKIDKIKRIRFTSPHPLHMDDEFIEEFATNEKVCKQIHIPLQSGSTNILKTMKRGYSKEWFLKICQKIKNKVPEVRITTDIIVGFPGESNNDFDDTIDVINQVRFDQIFNFKYSARPNTEAQLMTNVVDDEIATNRLTKVIELHKQHQTKHMENNIGKTMKVLFEDLKPNGEVMGFSDNGIQIFVEGSEELLGQIIDVKIISNSRTSLKAKVL
ncbi:tRNA-i(6)A37 methylthiotransferase [hydrothermal vent metagenome]|uniref:tRNA-i(6)A37 methylthiotransferase n=1 Tax=hydrothermal vent metagenome TaxID=652676 RepID=A0A3B1E6U1_9ZZZZ